jgi:hypothetical protein
MFKFICVILSNAIHNIFEFANKKEAVPKINVRGVAYCYSTEAGGLGAAISDFEQFRVYLGPVLLQNSHKNMSQLYTIVHS